MCLLNGRLPLRSIFLNIVDLKCSLICSPFANAKVAAYIHRCISLVNFLKLIKVANWHVLSEFIYLMPKTNMKIRDLHMYVNYNCCSTMVCPHGVAVMTE